MSDQQQTLFDAEPVAATTAHARRTDRQTSHEAAAEVTPRLTRNQQMVLRVARHFYDTSDSFTDVELVASYNVAYETRMGLGLQLQSQSGIRTRRAELVTQGFIREVGQRRIGKRNHTLWRVA